MSLLQSAKRIRYSELYKFTDEYNTEWYTAMRHTVKGILVRRALSAYTIEKGKVVGGVSGTFKKRKSTSSTFAIKMENGEDFDIQTRNLEKVSFNVNEFMSLDEVFNSWILNSDIAFWMLPDNKILDRKVFDKKYPVVYAFQFDKDDDRIIKCTCGIPMGFKYEINADTGKTKMAFVVRGWEIDKNSCDIENVGLVGNMETVKEYVIPIKSLVKEYPKLHQNREIIRFTADPLTYFSRKSIIPRKHKSIFDKDGK